MTRALSLALCCGALVAGCGRGPASGPPPSEDQQVIARSDTKPLETRGGARPAPTTVTGCLTASGDRLVLTELREAEPAPGERAAAGSATTDTYQLVNDDPRLRALVGREVRISGEAEAPQVAVVQQHQATTETGGEAVGTGGDTPRVATQEHTRIETHRMSVLSFTATGDACEAGGAGANRP